MQQKNANRSVFLSGVKDGIPIGLGYFAVAFALGIAAKAAGLNAFQGFLASILNNASAGEYAGFTVIAENAPYIEIALATLIANARYLLMSCALSQRMAPDMPLYHRLLLGFAVTDEYFAITVARPGNVVPAYTYGAIVVAMPCWAIGTALGVIAGNYLPVGVVSAFSVALYGMFLAVIVPPCRKDKALALLLLISFALSYAASVMPFWAALSSSMRTIILTVIIAGAAAVLRPVKMQEDEENAA